MKIKQLILISIVSIPLLGSAQDLTNWQVGVNVTPFIFTRFSPDFWPEKQGNNYPNGLGLGITIEKNWNENWGFKTGLEYTKQTEKYFADDNSADNTHIKSSFEYYKTPITIQYSYPIKEKLFLTFNQGIQFSFLKYYKMVEEGTYQKKTSTSDYEELIYYPNPANNHYYSGEGMLYSKTLVGLVGSIGLKYFIADKFSITSNLRYEYDLTDADNLSYYKTDNWKPVHNFRLGLEIGIQYHFSIGDRFDSRPHKL